MLSGIFLSVVLGHGSVVGTLGQASLAWGSDSTQSAEPTSSAAMAEGLAAFQRGDFAPAVAHWQAAARFYADTQQSQAQSMALTHVARAYEALGHYSEATQHLHVALALAEAAADRAQRALILGNLASLALMRGALDEAAQRLQDALSLGQELNQAPLTATLLYVQGNLYMAQHKLPEALDTYRDSATQAAEAQLFGVATRALTHAALAAEQQGYYPMSTILLEEALIQLRRTASSHDTVYDLLIIGRTYHRLSQANPNLLLHAAAAFTQGADIAQSLQDHRALSYAWGYLGRLYEEAQRVHEALDLTRRAALAAQQVHAPESLYLWQWQTGRLLRQMSDFSPAIAAYERAIDTVQSMRTELRRGVQNLSLPLPGAGEQGARGMRHVEPERKTTGSLRESLGPLYFELADLLLRRATTLESQPQEAEIILYSQYLQQARLAVEQFKHAELREYFGDECVAAAQPRSTALEQISQDVVILYPILLPDRTELLVTLPTGLKRLVLTITALDLEQRVRLFRAAIEERDPVRTLQYAQSFYTLFMRPLEAELAPLRIQTLIFVPDGALRLLPLAALHDGQQFLIEKYALAITPSLALTEPRPLSQAKASLLAAGLGRGGEGFTPLPFVAEELRSIQRFYNGTVLFDQDFSPESLDNALVQGAFNIVHIASHGHFAAEAAESFLLTSQGKLTMERLGQIIRRLRFRDRPIELLTLSACETAYGDDRAALGLAGVAIQAGARSALATLWKVADDATATMMTVFYQHLKMPGVSRARALQEAQRALLRNPRYAHPYFWAPFLLINNWL